MSRNQIHSLVDTIRNMASLAKLDFFVIFQDKKDKSSRRFAGTDDLLELFMRYDLLPQQNDIRLDPQPAPPARFKETPLGTTIDLDDNVIQTVELADNDVANQNNNDNSSNDDNDENDDDAVDTGSATTTEGDDPFVDSSSPTTTPRITETFSMTPIECTSTRSGRISIKPPAFQPKEDPDHAALRSAHASLYRAKGGKKKGKRKRMYAKYREPMSKCETCGKMFFSKHNMLRHVDNVHLGRLPFCCKLCGRGFPQKNSMQKHLVKCERESRRVKSEKSPGGEEEDAGEGVGELGAEIASHRDHVVATEMEGEIVRRNDIQQQQLQRAAMVGEIVRRNDLAMDHRVVPEAPHHAFGHHAPTSNNNYNPGAVVVNYIPTAHGGVVQHPIHVMMPGGHFG